MLQFVPFAGWRYDLSQVGDLSEVTSPCVFPCSEETQEELYQRHPCHSVRLLQNRDEPGDSGEADRHLRVDEFFRLWKREGILLHEHDAALYVCEQTPASGPDAPQDRIVSVIGRLYIPEQEQTSVVCAAQTSEADVHSQLELLKLTRAQFRPVQALLSAGNDERHGTTSPQPLIEAFDDLLHGVQHLTPLVVMDDCGTNHRLWPLFDRTSIDRLLSCTAHCRATIFGGADVYEAARAFRETRRAQQPAFADGDDSNFVMAQLIPLHSPGIHSVPQTLLLPEWLSFTADQLTTALGDQYRLERVGSDSRAADDACELAALSDRQPAIAVGLRTGEWFVVCPEAPAPASLPVADVAGNRRARLEFARKLEVLLCRQAGRAEYGTEETLTRFFDGKRSIGEQLNRYNRNVAFLLPPVSPDEIVRCGGSNDRLLPDSYLLSPTPLAGLVYNSLRA